DNGQALPLYKGISHIDIAFSWLGLYHFPTEDLRTVLEVIGRAMNHGSHLRANIKELPNAEVLALFKLQAQWLFATRAWGDVYDFVLRTPEAPGTRPVVNNL